jgi:hypothetical protein
MRVYIGDMSPDYILTSGKYHMTYGLFGHIALQKGMKSKG